VSFCNMKRQLILVNPKKTGKNTPLKKRKKAMVGHSPYQKAVYDFDFLRSYDHILVAHCK